MTTEQIYAFRADIESFTERLNTFAHILSDSNLMVKDVPKNAEPITNRQYRLLLDLIKKRKMSKEEKERWLTEMETMSKFDASELISSFIMGTR